MMEYEAATAESSLQCVGIEITLEKEGSRDMDRSELQQAKYRGSLEGSPVQLQKIDGKTIEGVQN
jgi:hypothetical protein